MLERVPVVAFPYWLKNQEALLLFCFLLFCFVDMYVWKIQTIESLVCFASVLNSNSSIKLLNTSYFWKILRYHICAGCLSSLGNHADIPTLGPAPLVKQELLLNGGYTTEEGSSPVKQLSHLSAYHTLRSKVRYPLSMTLLM